MRKYWHVAKMAWQLRVVYRANIILETSGTLLAMIITIVFWSFAFQKTGQDMIGDYSRMEMFGYLIISGSLAGALWHSNQGDYIIDMIRTGKLSRHLIKPYSITMNYIVGEMAANVFRLGIILATFVICVVVFKIPVWGLIHWEALPIFLLFLLGATLIHYLIFYCGALLAFWMEDAWGANFLLRVLGDVAAGVFVPLSMFSDFWQRIFDFLPFKYIISVPVNILLGRVGSGEVMTAALGSMAWLIALIALAGLIWNRGVRHFSAVGD